MQRSKRVRVFIRKSHTKTGICMLIENGVPCNRKVASRGLCEMHRTYLVSKGRLEEFALRHQDKRYRFEVKTDPVDGVCRLIVNGVPCEAPSRRRGLCDRHYAGIWQRPDLNIDDFAPPPDEAVITINRQKRPKPGICVVVERSDRKTTLACNDPIHVRGLCRKHYRHLSKTPELFEAIADPLREKVTYKLKKDLKPGICAIVHSGVGCTREAGKKRGVCRKHYQTLREAGLLGKLTDRFLPKKVVLTKKAASDCVAGYCQVIVNGVPCRNAPKRRGVCSSCLNLIEKNPEYDLERFARPPKPQKAGVLTRKKDIIKGICVAIEDGEPCRKVGNNRGLCRYHYKVLASRKKLPQFVLLDAEFNALPDVLMWYLDKNVIIDFAMYEVFKDKVVVESVDILHAVLDKRLHATISFDCIRALYTKLGHRLAWPVEDGGKGLSPVEAEAQARDYTGRLFHQRGGLWHILPNEARHHELCTIQGKLPDLSLEDALEVFLFGVAQCEFGVRLFVTADRGILERVTGMHPRDAYRRYEDVLLQR